MRNGKERNAMNPILLAILLVGGIGLIAGAGLAIASVLMAVPRDEKAEQIESLLPGANCGACGYSGCAGYAAALAKGEAKAGLCAPGGKAAADAIAAVLGQSAVAVARKTAVVRCMGSAAPDGQPPVQYTGIPSCAAAAQLDVNACRYGCLGFGDCAAVCPEQAIRVCTGPAGVPAAQVNPARCVACGLCTQACPRRLIAVVPAEHQAMVRCANCDKGAQTRKTCVHGCIGCGKCAKVCESGAIRLENNLAQIDPAQCTACGKCGEACPVGAIQYVR